MRVTTLLLTLCLALPGAFAAGPDDEAAIRKIVDEEVAAWNAGDAKAYAAHFAEGGTFTNLYGTSFEGHDAFQARHAEIFATFFKGTSRKQTIRKLRFVTPDVAIVDIDTEVGNVRAMPGISLPPGGILRTRLQQVFVKRNGMWWIEAYHNVEFKPPPPRAQPPKSRAAEK